MTFGDQMYVVGELRRCVAFFGIWDNKQLLAHKPDGIHHQCGMTLQQLNVSVLPSDSSEHDSPDSVLLLKRRADIFSTSYCIATHQWQANMYVKQLTISVWTVMWYRAVISLETTIVIIFVIVFTLHLSIVSIRLLFQWWIKMNIWIYELTNVYTWRHVVIGRSEYRIFTLMLSRCSSGTFIVIFVCICAFGWKI